MNTFFHASRKISHPLFLNGIRLNPAPGHQFIILAIRFSNVDLPLPFIPVTAVICPDKASAKKFLIIVLPSKHFVTPENVRRIMTSPLLPNSFLIELHPIRAACQNPLFLHQADLTGQRAPVAFQLFGQLDAARNTDLHRALMSYTLK